jgi:hypothetical protein
MTYTIDEKICNKKGLDLPSVLAIMLVKTGVNITSLFDELLKKEILVRDLFSSEFLVTQKWDDICSSVLLESDTSIPTEERLEALVVQLMDLFPRGKKPANTPIYWRGNKKDNKLRMQKFFKLYGNKYSDDQIIDATRRYVESFNGDYSYMRTLKYFIWKDSKKVNSEGNIYIEEVSDLATWIENEGQEDLSNNWTSTLK